MDDLFSLLAPFGCRRVLNPVFYRWERGQLLLREEAGTDEEPDAVRGLQGESAPPTRYDVNRQMRMLPVLVLLGTHVKRRRPHITEEDFPVANPEVFAGEAHRTGTVTASSGLVKQQWAVPSL
jgi:hypothetical protein